MHVGEDPNPFYIVELGPTLMNMRLGSCAEKNRILTEEQREREPSSG